jgi:hypothetical protein
MWRVKTIKRVLPAIAALLICTGCVHDMHYVSAKDRYYAAPAFASNKITHDSWIDEEDQTSARYTSSNLVAQERYQSAVMGNLYLRQSDDPNEESTVFSIRKENRAYTAETPILGTFNLGKKKVTTNFSIGHHKDHKVMTGLTFRMPF